MKISIKLIFGLLSITSLLNAMEAPKSQSHEVEQKSKTELEEITQKTAIVLRQASKCNLSPLLCTYEPAIVKQLILNKANVNAISTISRQTPLIKYCETAAGFSGIAQTKAIECCKLLIDIPELDVNAQDSWQNTALHCLIKTLPDLQAKLAENCFPLFEKLIVHNADPYISNFTSRTIPEKLTFGGGNKNKANLKAIALCVAQREKDLKKELTKYLDRDTSGMIIDYTWEDYEAATLPKKKSKEIEASESDSDDE